jgi:DNA modification methylase
MADNDKSPTKPAQDAGVRCNPNNDLPAAPPEALRLSGQLLGRVEYIAVDRVRGYRLNARRHSKKQVRQLAASIRTFGFVVPVLIDADGVLIAGHGRVQAAELIGLPAVPVIRLTHLTDAEARALRIADNRLTELGEWDKTRLAIELQHLVEIDFDIELTGFEVPEIDLVIEQQLAGDVTGPSEVIPDPDQDLPPITRPGDLWLLDEHCLSCGDALDPGSYETLLRGHLAQMVFTDPPYNVPIDGHVCGLGAIKHEDFKMASGEMTEIQFTDFLRGVFENLARFSLDGSMHFVCMDWRHIYELLTATREVYTEVKNVCIWAKDNGGMGSLYRSRHELVFVLKNGAAPHINNIELGRYGRNRTNVWSYAGVNTLRSGRLEELGMHPTVKPIALVADTIRDCSKRRGIVLDPFIGSGTTIIAAEQTGRVCYGLEIDPRYVDVAVRRWETFTGGQARDSGTGLTFEALALMRRSKVPLLPPPSAKHIDDDGAGS